jgi:lysophospholipase L1-like esterase
MIRHLALLAALGCQVVIGAAPPPTAPTRIRPVASDYLDSSPAAGSLTINGLTGVVQSAVSSRLRVSVPAGTRALTVRGVSNLSFALGLGVYVDGTWSQEVVLGSSDQTVKAATVTLDGLAHVVEVWTPYQEYATSAALIYDVQGIGISVSHPAAPTRSLEIYGDSIVADAQATPQTQNGWVPVIRRLVPATGFATESWGGRQLWDDVNAGGLGFKSAALLAARMESLRNGTSRADIWNAIEINDVSGGHYTSGNFDVPYGAMLDAEHAASPAATIYAQSALITASLEGTVPAWRAAVASACAARAWCTYVDGTTLVSVGNLQPDGVHPNTAGHAQYAASVKAFLGL